MSCVHACFCLLVFFLFDLLPGEQTLDVRDKSCSYSKQIEEGDMKIWKIGHGPKIMKKKFLENIDCYRGRKFE